MLLPVNLVYCTHKGKKFYSKLKIFVFTKNIEQFISCEKQKKVLRLQDFIYYPNTFFYYYNFVIKKKGIFLLRPLETILANNNFFSILPKINKTVVYKRHFQYV